MRRLLAVLLLAAVLTACGGEDDAPSAGSSPSAATSEGNTGGTGGTGEDATGDGDPDDGDDGDDARGTDDRREVEKGAEAGFLGARPDTGRSALQPGDTRVGDYIEVTVDQVRQRAQSPTGARPVEGSTWTVLRARTCVTEDADGPVRVGQYNFVGVDADGGLHNAAGVDLGDWPPEPRFPFEETLAPGDCARGWVLLAVAEGARLTTIGLDAGTGRFAAEWGL